MGRMEVRKREERVETRGIRGEVAHQSGCPHLS